MIHYWKVNESDATLAIALGGIKNNASNVFKHSIILSIISKIIFEKTLKLSASTIVFAYQG